VLVQLGDFGGVWYPFGEDKEQEYWLDWLADKPWTTAVVLGNHENYNIIETLPWTEMWGNEVRYLERESGNRIYFFKRGGIYEINGHKCLTIGGATSIDKHLRSPGFSWWEQEDISRDEVENCFNELDEKGYEVDYVFTHTCPSRMVMEFVHMTMYNQGKLHDHTAQFLDEIDNKVEFKGWWFGHMHVDWQYVETYDDGHKDYYTCCYNGEPLELTNWSPENPTLYH